MRDDGQDHAHLSVLKVIDADCWTRVQNRIDRKFKEKGYFFSLSICRFLTSLSRAFGWEIKDRGWEKRQQKSKPEDEKKLQRQIHWTRWFLRVLSNPNHFMTLQTFHRLTPVDLYSHIFLVCHSYLIPVKLFELDY